MALEVKPFEEADIHTTTTPQRQVSVHAMGVTYPLTDGTVVSGEQQMMPSEYPSEQRTGEGRATPHGRRNKKDYSRPWRYVGEQGIKRKDTAAMAVQTEQ